MIYQICRNECRAGVGRVIFQSFDDVNLNLVPNRSLGENGARGPEGKYDIGMVKWSAGGGLMRIT